MIGWRMHIVLQISILLIALTLVGPSAVAASSLTATEIVGRLESATDPIEDLTATIMIQTYKDGDVSFTQQMRLTLKQPDKMCQEYLAPDYLAGNITLVLMFRNILSGVRSDLDDYAFTHIDDSEVGDVYHIRGTPASDAAVYGRLDLWVNNETFTPVRRLLYDMDGQLLVDARFLNETLVDNVVTMPLRVETYNADGELRNVITYTKITLNTGVSDEVFAFPRENNG